MRKWCFFVSLCLCVLVFSLAAAQDITIQDLRNGFKDPTRWIMYSGDYTSFKYGDFWITVVPYPYDNGASANGWCDSENIPADDCYAKLISHTTGYPNATLPR